MTEAQLKYHGSIRLGLEQCRELGILPLECADIWNKHSAARISTYVIYGEPGSFCGVLNRRCAEPVKSRPDHCLRLHLGCSVVFLEEIINGERILCQQ